MSTTHTTLILKEYCPTWQIIVLLAPMCRGLKVRWLRQPLNAPLEWTGGAGISVGMARVAAACR